jgi:Zn ribbon nucleic-acid-binding protein
MKTRLREALWCPSCGAQLDVRIFKEDSVSISGNSESCDHDLQGPGVEVRDLCNRTESLNTLEFSPSGSR